MRGAAIHSLKLTGKERVAFQPSIFRGYVGFRVDSYDVWILGLYPEKIHPSHPLNFSKNEDMKLSTAADEQCEQWSIHPGFVV